MYSKIKIKHTFWQNTVKSCKEEGNIRFGPPADKAATPTAQLVLFMSPAAEMAAFASSRSTLPDVIAAAQPTGLTVILTLAASKLCGNWSEIMQMFKTNPFGKNWFQIWHATTSRRVHLAIWVVLIKSMISFRSIHGPMLEASTRRFRYQSCFEVLRDWSVFLENIHVLPCSRDSRHPAVQNWQKSRDMICDAK